MKSDRLDAAPIGARAMSIGGGWWTKVGDRRWQWCMGSAFPGVGGDWTDDIVLPGAVSDKEIAA